MTTQDFQEFSPADLRAMVANAQTQIGRHAALAKGAVGVAAWRMDNRGPRLLHNADQPFPMASTFKIAVACRALEQVDASHYGLGDLVEIGDDMRVSSSVIAERFLHPGIQLSVHNLIQVMLDESDNTATDVLYEKVGGGESITAMLRRWGIDGQRVDRDTRGLIRDFYEMEAGPFMPALLKARERSDHAARITSPGPHFEDDIRDTSSPAAMNMLLEAALKGDFLSPSCRTVLRDVMTLCRTADNRIRGLLPQETIVADKTGTIGGVVNDVGLISLPDGKGDIVLSIFIKKGEAEVSVRERTIAEISRTVFDFFLLLA